jgi:hypothetical protein
MNNNQKSIRWVLIVQVSRVAAALIFTALFAWVPRSGTIFLPAAAAQGQQRPLWVAEKKKQQDGDNRRLPDKGQSRESKTVAPVPAAGKSKKSSPKVPLAPFRPSEKIKPGQAVDFPADI